MNAWLLNNIFSVVYVCVESLDEGLQYLRLWIEQVVSQTKLKVKNVCVKIIHSHTHSSPSSSSAPLARGPHRHVSIDPQHMERETVMAIHLPWLSYASLGEHHEDEAKSRPQSPKGSNSGSENDSNGNSSDDASDPAPAASLEPKYEYFKDIRFRGFRIELFDQIQAPNLKQFRRIYRQQHPSQASSLSDTDEDDSDFLTSDDEEEDFRGSDEKKELKQTPSPVRAAFQKMLEQVKELNDRTHRRTIIHGDMEQHCHVRLKVRLPSTSSTSRVPVVLGRSAGSPAVTIHLAGNCQYFQNPRPHSISISLPPEELLRRSNEWCKHRACVNSARNLGLTDTNNRLPPSARTALRSPGDHPSPDSQQKQQQQASIETCWFVCSIRALLAPRDLALLTELIQMLGNESASAAEKLRRKTQRQRPKTVEDSSSEEFTSRPPRQRRHHRRAKFPGTQKRHPQHRHPDSGSASSGESDIDDEFDGRDPMDFFSSTGSNAFMASDKTSAVLWNARTHISVCSITLLESDSIPWPEHWYKTEPLVAMKKGSGAQGQDWIVSGAALPDITGDHLSLRLENVKVHMSQVSRASLPSLLLIDSSASIISSLLPSCHLRC